MAIAVIDRIRRGSSGFGSFAIAWQEDIKIAYLTVADTAERNAIPEWKRLPYMTVMVIAPTTDPARTEYVLGASTTIASQVWTIKTYGIPANVVTRPDIFDANGFILPQLIQNIFLNTNYVVASQAAMLALTTFTGNFLIRNDTSQVFIKLNNNNPSSISDFVLANGSPSVISVNGGTGVVNVTVATLLAVAQNVTDFNAAVNLNSTVVSNAASIGTINSNVSVLTGNLAALDAYTKTRLSTQLLAANVQAPTLAEDNYALLWDNTLSVYKLGSIPSLINPMTTIGDIIVGSTGGTPIRVGIGANTHVLTSNGTTVSWQPGGSGGGVTNVSSANANATVATQTTTPVITIVNSPAVGGITITGTPSVGLIPTATSAGAATWQTPSSGFSDPMTTRGDLIFRNASNTTARLGRGTANQILTSDGTDLLWATPSGGVTSVGASVPTFLSIVGSPITTSGTLAISYSGTALPIANGGTGITSFGTGVQTALGINIGTAGSFITNGGVLGTPSSGLATNLTGLPLTTGITGILPTSNGGTGANGFLQLPFQGTSPTGTASITSFFADASGRLNWRIGTGFIRTFDATALTADRAFGLPDFTGTLLSSGGNNVLAGATTLTGSGTNTLRYIFDNLVTTPVDGAGAWFLNTTAATAGVPVQISPSIVLEGQGRATTPATSQPVRFKMDVVPVLGVANPTGTFELRSSVNNSAYSVPLLSIQSNGARLTSFTNGLQIVASGGQVGGISFNASQPVSGQIIMTAGQFSIGTGGGWNAAGNGINMTVGSAVAPSTTVIQNAFNFTGIYQPATVSTSPTLNIINVEMAISATNVTNSHVTVFRSAPNLNISGVRGDLVGFEHNPFIPANITGQNIGVRVVTGQSIFNGTSPTANTTMDVRGVGTTTNLIQRWADGSDTERLRVIANGAIGLSGANYGTSGQVLTSQGSASSPIWQASSSGFADPMTTRGDLIFRNASNVTARLGRGTVNQVLTSDGTDLLWSSASGSGITRTVINQSTTVTAGAAAAVDYIYACTTTFTLTLPTAIGNTNRYTIKNSGTGIITVDTTSSQTIDDGLTVVIATRYSSIDLVSNGTNWTII